MPVVRISLMRPLAGRRAEVERLLEEIHVFFSQQKGFIAGFRFVSQDGDELGRIGVWESDTRADEVAQMQHTMVLRGRLHQCIQPGHKEDLYNIQGTPLGLPPRRP